MDDDDDDRVPVAWGDVGALVLAAGVAVGTLWLIGDMLLGGHPLAAFFPATTQQAAAPAGPTAEELRNTPMHLDPGEVRMNLAPPPKKPPPKPKL
jgi:hypothetical protein